MTTIIGHGKGLLTEPGEMYLGTIDVEGVTYAYVSDPTLCAVFIGNQWRTQRWDAPALERLNGDVEQAARHIVDINTSDRSA